MKRLSPGVYDDERGGMHLDLGELLRAHGFADTAANRATLEQGWRDWCVANNKPLTITAAPIATTAADVEDFVRRGRAAQQAVDDLIVRQASDAEQHAAIVATARTMVATGSGHECSEWVVNGRCELCDRRVS